MTKIEKVLQSTTQRYKEKICSTLFLFNFFHIINRHYTSSIISYIWIFLNGIYNELLLLA